MLKAIENASKVFLVISILGFYWVCIIADATNAAVTVTATVSSTMVTCETPASTAPLGSIDNAAIYATYTTTTISSSGSVFLKVYADATSDNPALYKGVDVIASATASPGTSTLAAGTKGYGVQATTVPAGTSMDISRKYYNWGIATSSAVVGGLATSSGTQFTVASSGIAVASTTVWILYKAAVSSDTPGGDYTGGATYSCTTS